MNKNTLTGFILMALVVFGFGAYENYNRGIQAEEMRIQDSINAVNYAKEAKEQQQKAAQIAEEVADTLNPLFEARTGKAGTLFAFVRFRYAEKQKICLRKRAYSCAGRKRRGNGIRRQRYGSVRRIRMG